MIANAARHGSYGINGQSFSYGNAIISGYYPDGSSRRTISRVRRRRGIRLARWSSARSRTSSSTSRPATIRFARTACSSGAAPDGSDIGANFPELMAAIEGVQAGVGPDAGGDPTPVPPAVDFSAACRFLECTFTDASIAGTAPLVAAAWSFGDSADVERQPRHACLRGSRQYAVR